jgi:hypothetical protein
VAVVAAPWQGHGQGGLAAVRGVPVFVGVQHREPVAWVVFQVLRGSGALEAVHGEQAFSEGLHGEQVSAEGLHGEQALAEGLHDEQAPPVVGLHDVARKTTQAQQPLPPLAHDHT